MQVLPQALAHAEGMVQDQAEAPAAAQAPNQYQSRVSGPSPGPQAQGMAQAQAEAPAPAEVRAPIQGLPQALAQAQGMAQGQAEAPAVNDDQHAQPNDPSLEMVGCDPCDGWFHLHCERLRQAPSTKTYVFRSCVT